MGAERFREQCIQTGISIDEEQARFIVKTYRKSNPCIPELWKKIEAAAKVFGIAAASSVFVIECHLTIDTGQPGALHSP